MSEQILFYEGKYYMFSNFASFSVEWNGFLWMTSEHAYQASKFEDEKIIGEIKSARSSYDSKRVAHLYQSSVRSDWGDVKLSIMEEIVRAKVDQHDYIKRKLLETGDAVIIEDSPTDSFWGWGEDKQGKNNLGKIWMKVRAELKP